ncbi:hypothetical protein [Streptomyces sp. NPDC055099]
MATKVRQLGSSMPIDGAPAPTVRAALHTVGTQLLARLHAHPHRVPRLEKEDLTRLSHLAGSSRLSTAPAENG